ncbi:MAG: hypothetical protein OXU26_10695, partial [Acidobacteriota bacterium]|nr:hypothetical protein [Acidobacteriota bacterium]
MKTRIPGVRSLACLGIALAWMPAVPALPQGSPDTSKAEVVKAFMAARTLRHNVQARKLMTAKLEKRYLRGKRLSIRVRSGRIAAFNFSPAAIFDVGGDKFQVSVESTWVDLNNQV